MQFEVPVSFRVVAASLAVALTVALSTGAPAAAVWDETPQDVETGEIVISELFVDPDAVVDSRGEFIELHNPTDRTVDLRGWTIGDEQYDRYEIRDVEIAAGGYAVLARFGESGRNGGIVADEVYGDAVVLVNRGDRVILRDSNGTLVDMVDYSNGAWPVVPGRSMAVHDLGAGNDDPSTWCLSTTTLRNGDLASPGRANTCSWSSAQLVISEVLFNPRATSDFVGEWFELTNVADAPVDLHGFTIQDARGESFRVDRSLVVEAGSRVVFGVTDDRSVNGDVHVDDAYGDAMRLLNAVDELIVNDADGVLVDRIGWDDGLTFPDPYGASMVLADLSLDGSDGANWCVSTTSWAGGDLGTPGTAGGCTTDGVADVVISEIMFDPERAGSERAGEWFELVNIGDAPAVLDGYRVRTYLAEHVIGSLTIEPGGVAVLAAEGDASLNGGVVADYVYQAALPLYNVAGRLVIVSPGGHLVDDVRWSGSRGFPHEPGRSIELRSADVDNALGANWCLADEPVGVHANGGDVDFGTPGRVGSCPEPAPVASVHVNEVMRRPSAVTDTFGEWIEIHNAMDEPVDMFNWTITDDGSDYFRVRSSLVVPAGGYVVVGRHGDPSVNGGVDVDVVTGAAMVLLNDRDSVVVTDEYGRRVDRVAWDAVGDLPLPRGASASLASDGSWCVTATQYGAGDRGTPGAPNDCVPYQRGAVVINEIHRDPGAIVDSRGEWVELHNRTDAPVDISGWTLRDDRYDSFTFDPGSPLVIEPRGFLVAARNGPALNGGIAVEVVYRVEINLSNSADDLTLLDRDLEIVDRVAWTATNGFPLVPGASMALRHPDLDGSIGANWCASITDQGNGDLGTPGVPNVCEVEEPPVEEPPVEEPPVEEPPVDEPPVEEPPVEEPPVDEPGTEPTHALFAVGASSCPADLEVRASTIDVIGDVRSNHAVKIEGGTINVDGAVSHGGPATIGWGATVTGGVHHHPAPETPTLDWQFSDFAPGGELAEDLGPRLYRHPGNLRINSDQVDLPQGVHVVDGDVVIKTSRADLTGVTIVAGGTISIGTTELDVSPFAPELPALLAAGGTCKKSSVSIGASNVRAAGVIMGLTGRVGIDASSVVLDGGVAGSSIKIGASTVTLGRPSS